MGIKFKKGINPKATNQGVVGSNPAGRASLIKGLQKCTPFSLAPTYLNRRYFLLLTLDQRAHAVLGICE